MAGVVVIENAVKYGGNPWKCQVTGGAAYTPACTCFRVIAWTRPTWSWLCFPAYSIRRVCRMAMVRKKKLTWKIHTLNTEHHHAACRFENRPLFPPTSADAGCVWMCGWPGRAPYTPACTCSRVITLTRLTIWFWLYFPLYTTQLKTTSVPNGDGWKEKVNVKNAHIKHHHAVCRLENRPLFPPASADAGCVWMAGRGGCLLLAWQSRRENESTPHPPFCLRRPPYLLTTVTDWGGGSGTCEGVNVFGFVKEQKKIAFPRTRIYDGTSRWLKYTTPCPLVIGNSEIPYLYSYFFSNSIVYLAGDTW